MNTGFHRFVSALLAAVQAGCSADAAPEPEPTLDTPGAFVAVENAEGQFEVLRTLGGLEVGAGQDVLFFSEYAPPAESTEEARGLARRRELTLVDELLLVPTARILESSWEVVWFRSLTEEERARLP